MDHKKELKTGWSTGACATAAAKAAFTALLAGKFPDPVEITLPRGHKPSFALALKEAGPDYAQAGVIKDAGDDPDVTHGALILATARRLTSGQGIQFKAGPGVGTVTKPGLPLQPGEPAINPAPRAMIRQALQEVADIHNTHSDAEITISVPNGEELAKHTWNGRLGIKGGISILGTTGIVHPYSCSAWIASIHRGIDVLIANHIDHAGAATGSTTEMALQTLYRLAPEQIIDMGDFAGGMLKYLRHHPIPQLTMALGFGKGVKLADGFLDLHSARSQVDLHHLASWAEDGGADSHLVHSIQNAHTAMEALQIADKFPLANIVAVKARTVAQEIIHPSNIKITIALFDRSGNQVSISN